MKGAMVFYDEKYNALYNQRQLKGGKLQKEMNGFSGKSMLLTLKNS